MTIFVNKVADKKEDSNSAPPEVAREVKVCVCCCKKLMVANINPPNFNELNGDMKD